MILLVWSLIGLVWSRPPRVGHGLRLSPDHGQTRSYWSSGGIIVRGDWCVMHGAGNLAVKKVEFLSEITN